MPCSHACGFNARGTVETDKGVHRRAISESSMRRRILIWLLLMIAVPAVAPAASWWNGDWKYRKEIVFDMSASGADVAGTAQDIPVLLRLSLANFNYFNDRRNSTGI